MNAQLAAGKREQARVIEVIEREREEERRQVEAERSRWEAER
jgi:hypothetical protein